VPVKHRTGILKFLSSVSPQIGIFSQPRMYGINFFSKEIRNTENAYPIEGYPVASLGTGCTSAPAAAGLCQRDLPLVQR
jgi:hypothetical protein